MPKDGPETSHMTYSATNVWPTNRLAHSQPRPYILKDGAENSHMSIQPQTVGPQTSYTATNRLAHSQPRPIYQKDGAENSQSAYSATNRWPTNLIFSHKPLTHKPLAHKYLYSHKSFSTKGSLEKICLRTGRKHPI